MNNIYFFILFSFILIGCKAQTNEEKMLSTTNNILNSFESSDSKQFQSFIGVSLRQIGKNEEMVSNDFEKIKSYIIEYSKNGKPKITITDGYNELGSKKVLVEFLNKTDSSTLAELQLFFGPPDFVPLNKISNYKFKGKKNLPDTPIIPPAIQGKQN